MPDSSLECAAWAAGALFCGIDEAGAGNLAGSCFLSMVIFPKDFNFDVLPKLNDSKKLSDATRFELERLIINGAAWYHTCEILPAEIDSISVYHAKLIAAKKVLHESCPIGGQIVSVFDGNIAIPGLPHNMDSRCLVKGDSKCYTIAAASILAKCNQRRQMIELDTLYPAYDFKNNSGYFSDKHADAIRRYGVTPMHRAKYVRNILKDAQ
jgi:ribonuclease HII